MAALGAGVLGPNPGTPINKRSTKFINTILKMILFVSFVEKFVKMPILCEIMRDFVKKIPNVKNLHGQNSTKSTNLGIKD